MITASLTNSLTTIQLPDIEVSLDTDTLENAMDVRTLDWNIYTDFINSKRQWTLRWDSLDQADYDALRAIYESQFTLFQYPTLDIAYYSIADVPVRISMNTKQVWNNCGAVQNVEITLRETAQIPEVS